MLNKIDGQAGFLRRAGTGSLGLALALCAFTAIGQAPNGGAGDEHRPGLFWWSGRIDGRGAADGLGEQARFSDNLVKNTENSAGIAVDAVGNTYVADLGNQTVRKIDSSGRVTTLAGKAGVRGSADGLGEQARFSHPAGIAIDRAGTLFVADSANHTVRKISPRGEVTTFAGAAGQAGADDGVGMAARFNHPQGIALDTAGNVYVTDRSNHTLRRITASGQVTTLAGAATERPGNRDGRGPDARFNGPHGLAVNSAGILYVTEAGGRSLRKVTPAGDVTTMPLTAAQESWGEPKGASVNAAEAAGIAFGPDDSLLMAESRSHRVRRVSSSGSAFPVAGNFDEPIMPGDRDGPSARARFYRPVALAADGQGRIFVLDAGNATVRRIDGQGQVSTVAGRARKLGMNGETVDGPAIDSRFNFQAYGSEWAALAQGPDGSVYVAEPFSHVIRRVTAAGESVLVAGAPGMQGNADGPGPQARFSFPAALVADAKGAVYVVDGNNHTIRKIDPQGRVSTLAGKAGSKGYANGLGAQARFDGPRGIGIDAKGNLYVSDLRNHAIRKIDPVGEVTTWAGMPGVKGHRDGPGAVAQFESPAELAADSAGTLFVVDGFSADRIRKIDPSGRVRTPSAGEWQSVRSGRQLPTFGALTWDMSGALYLVNKAEDTVWKVMPNGTTQKVAGDPDWPGWGPGPLPGRLDHVGGLTALGNKALALTSGNALMKLQQADSDD